MKKLTYWIVGIIVVIAIIIVAVNGGVKKLEPRDKQSAGTVKIGVMLALSGDLASIGEAAKNGIELAKATVNASTTEIIYEDSKCNAQDAVSAINRLVTQGVVAIIGETCSSATLAAAPIATKNNIPIISPSATSPKLTDAGDYIFRTIPSDLYQGSLGASLVNKKGDKTLAIIYTNEDYGVGLDKALSDNFTKLGGKVVDDEGVTSGSIDLRTQLTKIKVAKPDAIFVAMNSIDSGVATLKQIHDLGIKADVYASESLKSQTVLDNGKVAAEGLTVIAVTAGTSAFSDLYTAHYGKGPDEYNAQGYDAFYALNQAISGGAKTGETIKNALYDVSFDGATGHVAFDSNGDVAGGYNVFVVKNGAFVMEQ